MTKPEKIELGTIVNCTLPYLEPTNHFAAIVTATHDDGSFDLEVFVPGQKHAFMHVNGLDLAAGPDEVKEAQWWLPS